MLVNDTLIDIATGRTRFAKQWKNRSIRWSELVKKCSETTRTSESIAEYQRMSKDEQSTVKDVGGFVGGYLNDGVRKSANVRYNSVVMLDADSAAQDFWQRVQEALPCAAMLYSTHKHTADAPRYRLVIPLCRHTDAVEYEAVSRRLAEYIGIDNFDPTTFQTARLFFYPSTPRDGEFVFKVQDRFICDVDKVLATYIDFRNAAEWPLAAGESDIIKHEMRKAGDPTTKPGLIGAFCRAYSVEDAIETFLTDVYSKTASEGRYTYIKGSMAGGLVCYEHLYAYSYHATDPASMQLCNAFDIVRIGLFLVLDDGNRATDVTRKPSYKAMMDLAGGDKTVKLLLADERRASAAADFEGIEIDEHEDNSWEALLKCDKKGEPLSTIENAVLILENDPALKCHIYRDLLRHNVRVEGGLPWNKEARHWANTDEANLRGYLEKRYHITGKDRIKDAFDIVTSKHSRHPVREYLERLKWDGHKRVERIIIDYLGAEDSELNRAVTRIHMAAAVSRVMRPGCKYDYCLILAGSQGIGKSTFIAILGDEFYKDGLTSMEGKEGAEQVRGTWHVEISELDAMRKAEVSAVKQFITSRVDEYRPAYGTVKETYERQNIFWGTTNDDNFLQDTTGNRRFPIIAIQPELRRHGEHWFNELRENRDQIWAEALQIYRDGIDLYLPPELDAKMRSRQERYIATEEGLKGMVNNYLEKLLPVDWNTRSRYKRHAYFTDPDPLDANGVEERKSVCIAEFMWEYLGYTPKDQSYRRLTKSVKCFIEKAGWIDVGVTRQVEEIYGRQRTFLNPKYVNSIDNDACQQDAALTKNC